MSYDNLHKCSHALDTSGNNINADPFAPGTLGLEPGCRVVVAMSGGVDSSVVASKMYEAGFEVIGLTMRLYDNNKYGEESPKNKKACCAGADIYDAKLVSQQMGFVHYVLDCESRFQEGVIENFVDSYIKGYTPIPCVRCNQTVKFSDLLAKSKELGAKALCTGHYVQREVVGDLSEEGSQESYLLKKGLDSTKDQSYFLFATNQEQLSYLRFPLGSLPKTEVRRYAEELGLEVANKPDSQDICFVPNGDYREVINAIKPAAAQPGLIIDYNTGNVLGEHTGTINYTIGQRKGLGINSAKPYYVVSINPENNSVIVGERSILQRNILFIDEVNIVNTKKLETVEEEVPEYIKSLGVAGSFDKLWLKVSGITARIRSTGEYFPATVFFDKGDFGIVILEKSEYGIAPGQACVLYGDEDIVIGGGWIKSSNFLKKLP